MRRVLCLWFPHWPLQRLAAQRPELKQRPLLLYTAQPGGWMVRAFTPRLGPGFPAVGPDGPLRPGLPLAEALALGRGVFPNPCLEPHDPLADRAALETLARECQTFAPSVGLEEGPEPESLLLDLAGVPLPGGEPALLARVAQALGHRGYQARSALAHTPGAAWALAHYGPEPAGAEPAGDVPPGSAAGGADWPALAPLPVAALRLSEATVACLAELGIYTIGALAELPRAALSARFGSHLLLRLDQARGLAAEPVLSCASPPEWAARWQPEHPLRHRAAVVQACQWLLGPLVDHLAARRWGVLQWECRLLSPDTPPAQLELRLYQPSASAEHLIEMLALRLERLSRLGPLTELEVRVTAAAPLPLVQRSLLGEPDTAAGSASLADLIDRLTSRLGRSAVLTPWLLADPQPERACLYLPAAADPRPPSGGRSPRRRDGGRAAEAAPYRPLRLLARPCPLAVLAAAPDGPPARFTWRGAEHRVARAWGPERIETGWWRGATVRRDYYRVETCRGARYWLFRQIRSGRWYLHGHFD